MPSRPGISTDEPALKARLDRPIKALIRFGLHRAQGLSLLKNVFGPGRGWPLIAADDFHQPRGKSGDSCDLSARRGNSGNQRN